MKALLTRFSITASPATGAVSGLNVVPGLTGPQRRARIGRHVPHVDDRAPGRAPRAQQLGGALLQVRVVASAPARLVEAVLEIDEQQGGRVRFERRAWRAPYGRAATAPKRRCCPSARPMIRSRGEDRAGAAAPARLRGGGRRRHAHARGARARPLAVDGLRDAERAGAHAGRRAVSQGGQGRCVADAVGRGPARRTHAGCSR